MLELKLRNTNSLQLLSNFVSPFLVSCRRNLSTSTAGAHSFDVVVVGAGIIGLTIAREFLHRSDLSVAVVDAKVPRSGATAAGQGLIWMASKTPGTGVWDLARRSQHLWKLFADSIQDQGADSLQALGRKKAGSLSVGQKEAEFDQLRKQVHQLSAAGIRAYYLSKDDLPSKVPELNIGQESGAAYLPDDCQIDVHRAAAFIEKDNRNFQSKGRYAEFYHVPAVSLLRSDQRGKIEGIKTENNTLYGRKATIIATGCWTGSLMDKLLKDSDKPLPVPIKPRKVRISDKGHLLVLENFKSLGLNHGIMEASYLNNKHRVISTTGEVDHEALSISLLASTDASGNLVLGSSRQFVGFNTELNMTVVDRIWERAQEYFPALKGVSPENLTAQMNVRLGLRPFMTGGKSAIGPVPGMPNLFLASGHEGEGLCMSLGTAEMVTDMVLGNPLQIDCKPFSVDGPHYHTTVIGERRMSVNL